MSEHEIIRHCSTLAACLVASFLGDLYRKRKKRLEEKKGEEGEERG